MGYRLSKIYTKTGDDGATGLGDGVRVRKDDPRVEAYGEIDELNSVLGLLLSLEIPEEVRPPLTDVQHDLFDLGGELSIPGFSLLREGRVEALERFLDRLNSELKPLEEFILPGGTQAAAVCHLARTVCRRAERRVVALSAASRVSPHSIRYLNRLSDLLFVVARYLNQSSGVADVLWKRDRDQGESA